MIFVGDIALPKENSIDYNFPSFFNDSIIIANLEGALVKNPEKYIPTSKVVNGIKPIAKLNNKYKIHFSINNNHILDNNNFNETRENFIKLGLSVFGAGENIKIASKPLILEDKNILVLNFGWNVIECKYAENLKPGVNPLSKKHVISEFLKYKKLYPKFKLFVLFHWDYELEAYPMPSQRALSFDLIDLGCDLIVGAHPHRVPGYEYYKNKPIIYSVGNFLFAQNVYRSGTLKFPDFCNLELAFEFCEDGNHKCHFFDYNKNNKILNYLKSEKLSDSKIMNDLSSFNKIPIDKYDRWFKNNRYHRKIIPIYKVNDSQFMTICKDVFNRYRTLSINIISNFKRYIYN